MGKDRESIFDKADAEGKISRNEISRMKCLCEQEQAEYGACFALYCEQVDRTNKEQREFFDSTIPEILCTLENLEHERVEFVVKILRKLLKAEREMEEMIEKCRESAETAIASIDVKKDTDIVIERYKTGDFPPTDIQLEEMELARNTKARSITRFMNVNF